MPWNIIRLGCHAEMGTEQANLEGESEVQGRRSGHMDMGRAGAPCLHSTVAKARPRGLRCMGKSQDQRGQDMGAPPWAQFFQIPTPIILAPTGPGASGGRSRGEEHDAPGETQSPATTQKLWAVSGSKPTPHFCIFVEKVTLRDCQTLCSKNITFSIPVFQSPDSFILLLYFKAVVSVQLLLCRLKLASSHPHAPSVRTKVRSIIWSGCSCYDGTGPRREVGLCTQCDCDCILKNYVSNTRW